MKTKTLVGSAVAAFALAGALTLSTGAQAAELAHGVYYGGGNAYLPGNWTVSTVDGVELGLRGHVYQQSAPAPAGNVYNVALGDIASFDFSFDPGADGSAETGPFTSLLTITNAATGGSASFDPLLFGGYHSLNAPGGVQDSERLSFGFLNGASIFGDVDYDASVDSTYNISWTVNGGFGSVSNGIVIQQGAGAGAVPEPATWLMMIMGFGGMGATLRRRRQRAATAFA